MSGLFLFALERDSVMNEDILQSYKKNLSHYQC